MSSLQHLEMRTQQERGPSLRLRGGTASTADPVDTSEDAFVLHYHSSWPSTYMHYSLDGGKTWSVRPGKVLPPYIARPLPLNVPAARI